MIETPILLFEASLFAIAFFCMVVASTVLLSSKDGRSPANRYLVFFLVVMSIVMLMLFLISSGLIMEVPWLYRLPSPLFYLMFPAVYFYVRMVLLDETRLRKTDYLHAIPAVLHLIEMMPYYLSPVSNKIVHIMEDSKNPLGAVSHDEGWLPGYAHNLLRGFIGLAYALIMMRLIWKSRTRRPAGKHYFPEMDRWLWVLSIMLLVFSLSLIYTFLLPGTGNDAGRSIALYLMLAITQIVSTLYLLLNPIVLYGMPKLEKLVGRVNRVSDDLLLDIHPPQVQLAATPARQNEPGKAETDQPEESDTSSTAPASEEKKQPTRDYDEYIALLQKVMQEKKPFLRKRYALSDLAADVKVPQHHLSYLLNNIFRLRFNDYINQLRIQYLKERLQNEDLSHMTLEGLALEAGFSSRITFIRVVQKHTGMNPSDYFKIRLGEEVEAESISGE